MRMGFRSSLLDHRFSNSASLVTVEDNLQLLSKHGEDPVSWIVKAEHYFLVKSVPPVMHVHLSQIYMEGMILIK